jgi:serine protease
MRKYSLFILFTLFFITVLYANEDIVYNREGIPVEAGKAIFKISPLFKDKLHLSGLQTDINTIDDKLREIGITALNQHFQTNPRLDKEGLPDLTLILEISFDRGKSPFGIVHLLSTDSYIEYAEPVYIHEAFESPNDPNYSTSLYLASLQAESAWDIHKGEDGLQPVIVAVVDTGVRWKHPDLAENIWQNLGEDANGNGYTMYHDGNAWVMDVGDLNGIDDDDNGKIDDLIGWNFMANANFEEDNDPHDPGSHGTVVAGISGARTNNALGTASLTWNIILMPISCAMPGQTSSIYRGYNAIIYAAENGADVINCSWGGSTFSQANQDAVNYAYGLGSIIVAAAGNSNNANPIYPAALQNVVAVASLQNDGVKTSVSSFGAFVDVGAPAVSINSTTGNSSYATVSNATSWASPVGSALTALIKSYNPDWTQEQVINQLIATCDDVDALNPGREYMLGGGKLNAYRALSEENVSVAQVLKLGFHELLPPSDSNENNAVEPGENFAMNIVLRNYSFGVSEENAVFTLSSSSPHVTILNNQHIADIPSDSFFSLDDAFWVYISPTANSQYVQFQLEVSTTLPVVIGSTHTINVLIHNGGMYVWEGIANARNMSGAYIRNRLLAMGYTTTYGTVFPASFHSFDAVFLSFGTPGSSIHRFNKPDYYYALKEYLMSGGKLYIEGGDVVGFDLQTYFPSIDNGMSAHEVLYPILGIFSADDGDSNTITDLHGNNGWHTLGLNFSESAQTVNLSLDTFVPGVNGVAAFQESDYGIVGVQSTGNHGQRSFVFSYALRELIDGDFPNTRVELVNRIVDFFTADELILPDIQSLELIKLPSGQLKLQWDYPFWVDSFNVYYSADLSGDFETILAETEEPEYTFDPELLDNKAFFKIKAERSFGIDR